MQHQEQQPMHIKTIDPTHDPLVLTFHEIDASMLAEVGGKAANLGELTRAGFPVPTGFCLTTTAYALATRTAELEPLLAQLAIVPATDSTQLENCAALARNKLLAISVPPEIVEVVTQAYHDFAAGESIPVAVRSSATAEDLPFASFAGQQDTYLNIVGIEALLDAVKRCWASLWTDRAVSYRASNKIDPRTVRLAVVIQQMVEASVAGILFTANPLTGRRHQAVIDANPGLGEAVVSGAVNPDHFVVNADTGEILARRLGDKRLTIRSTPGGGTQRVDVADQQDAFCLTDEQVQALTRLGKQVEAHYGVPQDTEWAVDSSGYLWLTQARPITTLFPLPANVPTVDDDLHVYLSISVLQGVYRPLTPMGVQAFRLISSVAAIFALGKPPKNPVAGLPFVANIGQRLFLDTTPLLRNTLGREVIIRILQGMEAQSAVIFKQIVTDPRLAASTTSKWPTIRKIFPIALRTKIPLLIVRSLLRPEAARKSIAHLETYLRQPSTLAAGASSTDLLDAFEHRILLGIGRVAHTVLPTALAGMGSAVLATRLLKRIATPDEVQTVLRSLPHNPTTEMDLSLWALAQQIRADSAVVDKVRTTPPEQLAQAYHGGQLPPLLQQGLAEFLRTYGHRAVAEIDLGLARWSEDPTHILGMLANYLQLTNPELAPNVQFERGAQEAEAMVVELTQRARRKGWFYGKLVRFNLQRIRELTGIREYPKYCFILLFAHCRELLWPVGEGLALAGRLEKAEDIFFIDLAEARAAVAGQDFRAVVHERRANYEQEMGRRHIPRVLLSDGTEPEAEHRALVDITEGTLTGAPASAGVVTGIARVIMDPVGARLEPGEILVAPSTDPGWTPLFLTAGGLVMEMGGSMSHGSVVAREYGIPAVVGVHGATERIVTGQRITVDGSNGVIIIEPAEG
ncbi:MAG: PEP/pyruvate-binding domain-containing protein [Ktedonobacteraceae bacterium]